MATQMINCISCSKKAAAHQLFQRSYIMHGDEEGEGFRESVRMLVCI